VTSVGLALKDPPMALVPALAVAAEVSGLSHLLTTELSVVAEPASGRDPFLVAAAALSVTSRLQAGTGVVGSVFHAARHLALSAATLHEQSGGRFVLGVGVAHRVFAEHIGWPYPASPITHARDYLDELARYNDGGLAFGAGFPVWLAALGDRMLRTAAAGADGVLLNWVTPDAVRAGLAHLAAHDLPRPAVAVFVRVGTREQLETMAGRYGQMFANYRRHFERQELADAADAVTRTCAVLDGTGRLDDLAALVDAYAAAGVDHVLLYPADVDPPDVERFIRALDVPAPHPPKRR